MAHGQDAGWTAQALPVSGWPWRPMGASSWRARPIRVPRLVHGGLRDHRGGSVGGRSRRWFEHRRDPGRPCWCCRTARRWSPVAAAPTFPGGYIPGVTAGYGAGRNVALGGVRAHGDDLGDGPSQRRRLRHGRLRRADHVLARLECGAQQAADGGHVRHSLDGHRALDRDVRRSRVDRSSTER